MKQPKNITYQYEEIENGALILQLLREDNTWEGLCQRFEYADPNELKANTTTMTLLNKLRNMKDLGLIEYEEEETQNGLRPHKEIISTDLWPKIRIAFGGMSLSEVALLSRHSTGVAIKPVFKRPRKPEKQIDVFVLMPFKSEMKSVYTNHIKKLGDELNLNISRADDIISAAPFMEKVWNGIYYSELIIADCTQNNPNVFYEIGIAHTVGKQVILITRSEEEIPSDIKHYDYIPYVYDPEGVTELINKLRGFIVNHFNL